AHRAVDIFCGLSIFIVNFSLTLQKLLSYISCVFADQGYVLIQSEKDWCQALQYCKKFHKGLATINNTEYNDLANKTSKGLTVWIGLMHDQWEWPNKECSLFREWADTSQGGSCVYLTTGNSHGISTEGCESERSWCLVTKRFPFTCTKCPSIFAKVWIVFVFVGETQTRC
uniref:C-type lectin domain-containing protein n=1 Tax=Oryzias latipes TaxID=8090 RepID=A0A3P9JJY9_ORYLA